MEYLAPGVYYERVDATPPTIAAVRTDVAAFVGIAERGPVDTPVPIESWRQFQAQFGGFIGTGYLAYVVRAFLGNGGRRCWVVRVASMDPIAGSNAASALVPTLSGKVGWQISASSRGIWGNKLHLTLRETRRAQTVTDPSSQHTRASRVYATSGFDRASLVRLSQEGHPQQFKVVSDVDAVERRLFWVHPDRPSRLAYDMPVTGLDLDREIFVESVEYSLLVSRHGRLVALFDDLSIVPEHPRYAPIVLAPWQPMSEAEAREKLPAAPLPVVWSWNDEEEGPVDPLDPLDLGAVSSRRLEGGRDGLSLLTTYDFLGESIDPRDSDEERVRKSRGLQALGLVDEVAMVAIPDIHIQPRLPALVEPPEPCVPDPCLPQTYIPPAAPHGKEPAEVPPVFTEDQIFQVQVALIEHCEGQRDRVALLDPPYTAARDDELGPGEARAWRRRFDSKYAAFYYPWIRVVDPLPGAPSPTRELPPTGHVAGQFARTDLEVGVHKAPANGRFQWAQDATVAIDENLHGVLNPLGINAIRAVPGRGLRILGARTISSDPDWRYVNVRRLLMMIEEAVELSTQWAAFEPNHDSTRAKLRLSLVSYLLALWQTGALSGATAEEAFFVKCDEVNNPPAERERGRLIVDVGVAPSNPFEFVVLRVGRTENEFEVIETAWERHREATAWPS